MYDDLSPEAKKIYDDITNKRDAEARFGKLSYNELAAFINVSKVRIDELKTKVAEGGQLTETEQKELAEVTALHGKAKRYFDKKAKAATNNDREEREAVEETVRTGADKKAPKKSGR